MAKQTYQRIDLAKEQLDLALELFLSNRSPVSVITLAGAAEEIFGKALSAAGEETVLDREYEITAPIKEIFLDNPYPWKEFIKDKNGVRNAAKHMRDQSETEVVADLEYESLYMLVRAYDNYTRLDLPKTERMDEFDDWYYKYNFGCETSY